MCVCVLSVVCCCAVCLRFQLSFLLSDFLSNKSFCVCLCAQNFEKISEMNDSGELAKVIANVPVSFDFLL